MDIYTFAEAFCYLFATGLLLGLVVMLVMSWDTH